MIHGRCARVCLCHSTWKQINRGTFNHFLVRAPRQEQFNANVNTTRSAVLLTNTVLKKKVKTGLALITEPLCVSVEPQLGAFPLSLSYLHRLWWDESRQSDKEAAVKCLQWKLRGDSQDLSLNSCSRRKPTGVTDRDYSCRYFRAVAKFTTLGYSYTYGLKTGLWLLRFTVVVKALFGFHGNLQQTKLTVFTVVY